MCSEDRELDLLSRVDRLERTVDFYKRRYDQLQLVQRRMRDPERTMVCDILANGHLLHESICGDRYEVPADVVR